MTKRIRLTRKGFREWLEGKPAKQVVGYSGSPAFCPIAEYLDTPIVSTLRLGDRPMPKWTSRYIRKVDREMCGPITARQALAVLDGKEPTDA